MDQDPSVTPWAGNMANETMVSHERQDEFTDLLDFDFDFGVLNNVADQSGNAMPASTAEMSTTMMQDVQLTGMDQIHQTTQPSPYPTMQSIDMSGNNAAVSSQVNPQFYAQKQQQQSLVTQNYGQSQVFIPPTPNSLEMHGRASNYPMRIDTDGRRIYEPYARATDDQSAFTPLISPAMTPLEQHYRMPDYTVPGENFTPLTSPALEGRNPGGGFFYNNPPQIDMNFVTSPVEFPSQMPNATAPSSPGAVRKHRRKKSFQSRTGTRLVRQSPSVRPLNGHQRTQTIGSLAEDALHFQANQASMNRAETFANSSSTDSSGQDSVSPEPLSEPLMPPPALPRSGRSPHIAAQESRTAPSGTQAPEQVSTPAVTPATLMRLQNQQHRDPLQPPFSRSGSVVVNNGPDEVMEDIFLPEPASGAVQPTTSSGEQTPSITPKQAPVPTSARPGTTSAGPSPQIGAMPSPAGPVGLKRSDSKPSTTRSAKKRQSTHSTQISPALRPKISPSIKPLIKGTDAITAETSALYLASKSNYQHILDGTVLPGVTYPESLAENLSSKRTNHKLAEQGRRNRINTALKEIESLLPDWLIRPQIVKDKDKDKEHKDVKNGKDGECNANGSGTSKSPDKPAPTQPISKASTVEMAIVYIKSLQKELAETQEKLRVVEAKLDDKNGSQPPLESVCELDTASQPSEGDKDIENPSPVKEKADATQPNGEAASNESVSTEGAEKN
ncbi:hypothetical protein VTO42DRAFT_2715 [Malbranchea cinnamomea]